MRVAETFQNRWKLAPESIELFTKSSMSEGPKHVKDLMWKSKCFSIFLGEILVINSSCLGIGAMLKPDGCKRKVDQKPCSTKVLGFWKPRCVVVLCKPAVRAFTVARGVPGSGMAGVDWESVQISVLWHWSGYLVAVGRATSLMSLVDLLLIYAQAENVSLQVVTVTASTIKVLPPFGAPIGMGLFWKVSHDMKSLLWWSHVWKVWGL